MTGMRSCNGASSAFASVVTIVKLLIALRAPHVPQPGQCQQAPVGARDGIRLPPAARLLPFVETVHRHEAAAATERLAKGGLAVDPFGLGVEGRIADLRVLRPERHKPPTHDVETALLRRGVVEDDRQILRRRRVPTGGEVRGRRPRRDGEDAPDLAEVGKERSAAAHAAEMARRTGRRNVDPLGFTPAAPSVIVVGCGWA
jgi:hypothetical protein